MLKQLDIKEFTVFEEANLRFGKQLNVIVGENGAGKTHLLKLAYSGLATCWEEGSKPHLASSTPTKTILQKSLADKLLGVFRPETLGRLVRRKPGRGR
ncbi:hypothetical protein AQS70_12665 [Pseudomonas endophytica]|uniref:Rad50/SbcC-type AAA domain-containing protein n=1 Tax=Pseudomonas endophytica TaxID=1563157 RepID=A0A0Q0SMV3_9PSED|nr:AAA family ATPase [Pseudomonas endophytica]KQB52891.1 hypothetical protein AQS70_12665 [Pseudomonas endophytica]